MTLVKPHTEVIHNALEYFNELSVLMMQYLMIFFLAGGQVEPEHQWQIGFAGMAILGLVFSVNIVALMYLTIRRIYIFCKLRKARQALMKER